MGASTEISWTDATWNPVRGCSRVSPGCEHCYAETVAARFSGPGLPYEGLARRAPNGAARWTGEVRLVPEHLADPLRWTRPRRIFVNSMSDLFHERLTNEEIAAVFGVMAAANKHTFQVLTKRPERMLAWFAWVADRAREADQSADFIVQQHAWKLLGDQFRLHRIKGTILSWPWPLPNVWIGVSVEDQTRAYARIPIIQRTPAAVRFVSAEPLLDGVDLTPWLSSGCRGTHRGSGAPDCPREPHHHHDEKCLPPISWVIVGGESGPGARPFDIAWARTIVAACKRAGVACFVKQMGAQPVDSNDDAVPTGNFRTNPDTGKREIQLAMVRLPMNDRKGGNMADWPEDLRVRQFPGGTS